LLPDLLPRVREAKEAHRPIVLVSMGTYVPGEGWEKRYTCGDGKEGLSGKDICRAVWKAAFDAFGAEDAYEGPLMLVALGQCEGALGDLVAPANAICAALLPQVDILRIGVTTFLTHGGQNSFMEALSTGTPMVMCPFDMDQPINARKAVSLGVALEVARPDPVDDHATVVAQYSVSVRLALQSVHTDPQFSAATSRFAGQVKQCGGVPQVVETLLAAGSLHAAS